MPGRKTTYDMTYLTALRLYRGDLTLADALGPDDEDIPEIRLDIDETKQYVPANISPQSPGTPKHEVSARAYNGQLMLYALYTPGEQPACEPSYEGLVDGGLLNQNDDRCHADIRVWAWDEPYDRSVNGRWCLYHEQSVLTDTLIAVRNIPNTKYKVTISFINGGSVNIVEQHTV